MHFAFLSFQGEKNGLAIFIVDPGLLWPECIADLRHRKTGEAVMTFFYIVGAIAALLLVVYLVIALLKPELFS
jgi:K+-transporting ATPase KdpF subunit